MKNILLIAGLCVIAISSRAQNIKTSTVSWYIAHTFDITTGEMTATADTIVSVNTSEVKWKKMDGSSDTFPVKEAIGQWSDVTQPGKVTYEAGNEAMRGTITFERTGDKAMIRLMMMKEEVPFFYELTISGHQFQ